MLKFSSLGSRTVCVNHRSLSFPVVTAYNVCLDWFLLWSAFTFTSDNIASEVVHVKDCVTLLSWYFHLHSFELLLKISSLAFISTFVCFDI